MKISYKWLREYVDFDLAPGELSERLTLIGLEVDTVTSCDPGLEGVIAGEITEIEDHPNADKLKVCRVDTGGETVQTVSGAPNLAEGARVPYAPVGTVLPGGNEVRAVELRGVPSRGMILSTDEMGLQEERAEGIMILPGDSEVGADIVPLLDLDDFTLELDLTPNYGHCLSMLGVAREVAAMTGSELRIPPSAIREGGQEIEERVRVSIADETLCPRYSGRMITGVEIGPSPLWMQQRLRAVGVRPINNVVDITNYVMIELGQPLHAFDYDTLSGNEIVVRPARPGEELVTLDGVRRELDEGMLLIADREKPVGLAGVMGGLNSEVTAKTERIFLESANFNPVSIRRTSKRLDLPSEAAYRFERGVDIAGTVVAATRAAELLRRHAEGTVLTGVVDEYPSPVERRRLRLRSGRANQILGVEIEAREMKKMLGGLGFEVSGPGPDFTVTVPSFRTDVEQEADLIEEVARSFGYDNVGVTLPATTSMGGGIRDKERVDRRVRQVLIAAGCTEVQSYSFIAPGALDNLNLEPGDVRRSPLRLRNPLSEERSVMRTTLIPGLIDVAALNTSRSVELRGIFELGRVFIPHDASGDGREGEQPEEPLRLGVLKSFPEREERKGEGFFHLKGIIEALGRRLGLIEHLSFCPSGERFLHPGRRADVTLNDGGGSSGLGFVGELHPDLMEDCDLEGRVVLLELDYETILEEAKLKGTYSPLPRYPALKRDMAVVVDRETASERVVEIVRDTAGDLIEDVELFDVYEGEQIPENRRSLAYSLTYRSPERTLTDGEVNELQEEIRERLREELNATLREA